MGRVAGLVVAKRLIDIIPATDNSLLAGPRRSLALQWRGLLQRCVWKSLTLFEASSAIQNITGAWGRLWFRSNDTLLETNKAGFLQFCQMLARERQSILSSIDGLRCPGPHLSPPTRFFTFLNCATTNFEFDRGFAAVALSPFLTST